MRGVDASLQALKPVALLQHLGGVTVRRGHLGPLEPWHWGFLVDGAHVGPDHVAHFHRGIGLYVNLVGETDRLVHLVHTVAVNIVLPAVIDAPQTTLFIPSQP